MAAGIGIDRLQLIAAGARLVEVLPERRGDRHAELAAQIARQHLGRH